MKPNDPVNRRAMLFRQLIWIARKHRQRCDMLLESHGIGSGQIPVLLTLDRHMELTQRELAEQIRVTPATISSTLKRMERMGIIRRAGREEDARISVVSLTPAGEALVGEARRSFDQTDEEVFGGFTDEDFLALENLLTRMQENISVLVGSEQGCPKFPPKDEG